MRLANRLLHRFLRGLEVDFRLLFVEHHAPYVMAHFGVNLVLDVGAHAGETALNLRRREYRGRIASFEPVGSLFGRLQQLARSDPDWDVYPYALGNTDGTAPIRVPEGSDFSSFLEPSEFSAGRFPSSVQNPHLETVEVRRLDSVFDEVAGRIADPRIYLKLDTQGFDLVVFAGAQGHLDRIVALQSELSVIPIYKNMPSMTSALDEYRSHGFAVTGLFPVTRTRDNIRVIEFDCVMVRGTVARQDVASRIDF